MATTKRMPKALKSQTSVVKLIRYILNPQKTEDEKCIYSGSDNCAIVSAAIQFQTVRQMWDKDSGNLAYHFIQSFAPGEVTPAEAFECGKELAAALFGNDGYQVIFATHLDREHLHNHFCVNAVNIQSGKKLQTDHAFIRRMRSENDRICRLHNLSVITEPKGKGKTYAEYQKEKDGGFTWRGSIRQDIDAVIPYVCSFKELVNELQDGGYTVARRGKYLRLSPPGTDTFFRFAKLGHGYSEEELTDKILYSGHAVKPKLYVYTYRRRQRYKLKGTFSTVRTRSRLEGMYYVYLYRLRSLYRSPPVRKTVPLSAKQDMLRLRQLSEDLFLIRENHISDTLGVSELYYSLREDIKKLNTERAQLRTQLAEVDRVSEQLELRRKIDAVNSALPALRKKAQACERIYERSEKIAQQSRELAAVQSGEKIRVGKSDVDKEKIENRKEDDNVSRS